MAICYSVVLAGARCSPQVRSGQRIPLPSKVLGLGVVAYLRMGPAHDPNPTETCRTQYSSAINGTDSSAMLPKSGTAAKYFCSV